MITRDMHGLFGASQAEKGLLGYSIIVSIAFLRAPRAIELGQIDVYVKV